MKLTASIILFLVTTFISQLPAQEANVKQLVDAKRYIFRAQSVTPTSGGIIQLSRGYDLTVMPDSVIAYLPYYGRVYQAPTNTDEAGIKFTSINFDYTQKERKKGGWDIVIKPKDARNSIQMFLTISENGRTLVNLTSSDRQSISYKGYIEGGGKK